MSCAQAGALRAPTFGPSLEQEFDNICFASPRRQVQRCSRELVHSECRVVRRRRAEKLDCIQVARPRRGVNVRHRLTLSARRADKASHDADTVQHCTAGAAAV